ncbi:MAG: hypothetical protein AUI36_29505 [Cyanobacteria bacterium 13_1_40CM_2_61_4]|nr:MAG: hypothetical protein AUI36_29505 [Cyanobacteria bacterium 13_1_40CM_2_61_4]
MHNNHWLVLNVLDVFGQSLSRLRQFNLFHGCILSRPIITSLPSLMPIAAIFTSCSGRSFHVIVYPQIAKAQLPGCQRIGAHLFSVSGLYRWFVHQLLVYTSKNNGALPRGERAEMSNRRLHILNAVGQMLGFLSCRAQR